MGSLRRDSRLDWSLALGAVAIGVLSYLLDDRTNWTGGFGFDGRFYGELARNFPSAVFGDGAVIPPGIGPYEGPQLTGVDSYYAFRILPSGIVWLMLEVLDLSHTRGDVIAGFAALNAAMFGVAVFCWCRIAALLDLGNPAKVLGAIALVVNFAAMKTGGYYPVLTDQVALGLGALSLYLWLCGRTIWLALCIVAASFTWPLHLAIGALLLLFPAPADLRVFAASRPGGEWTPSRFGLAAGGLAGAVTLGALVLFEMQGYDQIFGTDRLPVFPLAAAVTAVYASAVVAYLVPRDGLRGLLEIFRTISARRLTLAGGVIACVLVAASLLARREGTVTAELTKDAFWSTTLDPGLFIVVLVCYFGPLLLFVAADFPRVAADAWRLGPGMVGALAIALFGAFLTQPRSISSTVPFLVLFGALAARRIYPLTLPGLAVFGVVSVLLSRLWLHIGPLTTDLSGLQEFPLQRYYMSTGTWTPPSMYAVQLGALIAIAGVFWLVARRQRPARALAGRP